MILRTGVLATLFCLMTSQAGATSSWLLNHAEFSRLTAHEKKEYVREIQRIVAGLPERSRSFAVQPRKQQKRLIASTPTGTDGTDDSAEDDSGAEPAAVTPPAGAPPRPEAPAPSLADAVVGPAARAARPPATPGSFNFGRPTMLGIPAAASPPSTPADSDAPATPPAAAPASASATQPAAASAPKSAEVDQLVGQAEKWWGRAPSLQDYGRATPAEATAMNDRFNKSMWWLVTARVSLNEMPKDDPKRADLEKRVSKLETFYLGGQKVFTTSIAKNDELKAATLALQDAHAGKVDAKTPNLIPAGSLVNFDSKKVVNLQAPVSEGHFYRCMYAGFVLKHDPCRGPQGLPDDVTLTGLSREALSCKKSQVLCNPLLFGVKAACDLSVLDDSKKDCLAKAKPLCVRRSVSATSDCGSKSNDASVGAAAALITANPEAWNSYLASFYELCDDKKIALNEFAEIKDGSPREIPERTRADIEQTCSHAKDQLGRIAEKYRTIETKRPESATPPAEATKGER